jgi:hypothetical protein
MPEEEDFIDSSKILCQSQDEPNNHLKSNDLIFFIDNIL